MKREVLQVNFAFLVMKTMRYYGWTWQETMSTPVSAFWACYGYIERLRADESMQRLPESCYAWADADGKKSIAESLQEQIGNVVVDKPVFDRDGWRSLQKLSQ